MKEGRTSIPPIAGIYLFQPRATSADAVDLPFVEGMRADRDPYTEATLARAIREGVGANGKPLSYVMPRYRLDDAAMGDLIAYLKDLSPGTVPGVTDSVLHFATIVAPDADPLKRQGVLDVLTKFFEDKNHYVRAESPRLHSSRRMMFKVNRRWQLHIWELTGASDTWQQQLRAKLAAEPVFAVISGLGGADWAPVQRFCEAESLPCLFPNADVPVVAEDDFYTLYFSKAVLLEAQLIARSIRSQRTSAGARRVIQIYRPEDAGSAAAEALSHALEGSAIKSVTRPLEPGVHPVGQALRDVGPEDEVVLWLRPEDVALLGKLPGAVKHVYLSGRMSGLERAPLPAEWRSVTHIAYPVDLPERRVVGLDRALGWFRIRQIQVVDQPSQADTILACGIVSDAINHMVDTFVRDYLVERIEAMLEHSIVTGYYPRLALAPHQRFASKGGYIVKFAAPTGTRVVAETDWIVP